MKHNWKKYFWIFLWSALISIAFSPLRGGYVTIFTLTGLTLSSVVYFIVFCGFTMWMLNKYRGILPSGYVILTILLGAVLITDFMRIYSFRAVAVSFPDCMIRILAVFVAWGAFKIRPLWGRIVLIGIAFAGCLWMSFFGYDYWLHRLNYGTFCGQVEVAVEQPLIFQNSQGDTVALATLPQEYIVLDFFSSSCGSCFEEMPIVQQLSDKYKADPRVGVYTVFCKYSTKRYVETLATGDSLLRVDGYTIPCLAIDRNDPAADLTVEAAGVTCYPTVLIYDKKAGKIIFRGDIKNTEAELHKLLL